MADGATTQAPAIETSGLCKRFGAVGALEDVELRVAHGAFFGLLGPNGAGKTTAVSVLTTLLRPSQGRARLLGRDVVRERDAVRRDIGIVFQEPSLDPALSAREHLDLQARLYHLADRRRRVEELLDLVDLGDAADRPVRGFSGGMKRRLEIARGLLHEPRVLFLDEPTLGLDVHARARVWSQLRTLHRGGTTTLFLTTHSMQEADALCDRIAILDRGRVVAQGTPQALKAALGGDVVELTLAEPRAARDALARLPDVGQVRIEPLGDGAGARVRISVADGPRRLAGIVDALRGAGIQEVHLHRPTLEDVFLRHTGRRFERDAPDAAP